MQLQLQQPQKKMTFKITPKTQQSNISASSKQTFPSAPLRLKPKFQLKMMSPNITPKTIKSTTRSPPASYKPNFSTFKPFTFKPFTTTSTEPPKIPNTNSFTQINWRFSQPADTESKKLPKSKVRANTGAFSTATSSRITIIEATPMPKEGETFPTVKHFETFTPATTRTTSIKSEPLVTDYIKKVDITSRAHVQSPFSIKKQHKQDVLMPGSSNHRTMVKPPQLESDSTININSHNTNRGPQNNSNNMKIKYNAPPRRVFQAHRAPQRRAQTTDQFSHTTVPTTTITRMKQNRYSTTLPPATDEIKDALGQGTQTIALTRRPISTLRSKSNKIENSLVTKEPTSTPHPHTTDSPIKTSKPPLAGRPSRYNTLQRLRDFMARKRATEDVTSSNAAVTTTITPATTKHPFMISPTLTPTSHFTTKTSTTSYIPKSFTSYRTHMSRTTPITRRPQTTPITLTKKPLKSGTPIPQPPPHFKHTDSEPSGSDSSPTDEWRPPIHDIFLQDHPEMFDLYNWESTRLDLAEDRSDIHPQLQDKSHKVGNVDTMLLEASNISPVTVLPMQQITPLPLSLESSDLEVSPSNPTTIIAKQNPLPSSSTQVQEETFRP